MSENKGGFVQAFKNMVNALASVFTTASWRAEEKADEYRTAQDSIERIDEEVEMQAEQIFASAQEALVERRKTEIDAKNAEDDVNAWQAKAQSLVDKAKAIPENDPDPAKQEQRKKLLSLATEALETKRTKAAQLAVYQKALAETDDEIAQTKKALEEMGLNVEKAFALQETLRVEAATADTKIKLSNAFRKIGPTDMTNLISEARQKVTELKAKADAQDIIDQHMPKSPDQVETEIELLTRNDAVQAELAEMMK